MEQLNCEQIATAITDNNNLLTKWRGLLTVELKKNYTDKNIKDIRNLMDIVEHIEEDLDELMAQQLRQGCQTGSSEISQDNQTVIATSSVRRKDAKALEIINPAQ